MSRVGRTCARPRGGLTEAQKTAIDLAADAELDGVPTMALLDAADFVLTPDSELLESGGERNCTREESDPEDWFPLISTEIGPDPEGLFRMQERELGQRLCGGCPERRRCLVRALNLAGGDIGIWGALGARDRADLAPVWRKLRACLGAETVNGADCQDTAGAWGAELES